VVAGGCCGVLRRVSGGFVAFNGVFLFSDNFCGVFGELWAFSASCGEDDPCLVLGAHYSSQG
jgi:hypothetical protein